jgi:hypothetical protein
MELTGQITKMRTTLADVVQYELVLDGLKYPLNPLLGEHVRLEFQGEIRCVECGKKTRKSFGEGFCYPCFMSSPSNSPCIIRPELCEGHLGTGRCVQGKNSHVNEHFVYLALSSEVKVGVTRSTQVPHRWIDQGASAAIRFATVPYRKLAGDIEVNLKAHLTDKTSWQKMLRNQVSVYDLLKEKQRVKALLPEHLHEYVNDEDEVTEINYPVISYPEKVASIGFDKVPVVEGKLMGIKGQYLMFDNNRVLNLRSHSGYVISVRS